MKSEVAHTLKSLTYQLYPSLPLTPRASQQLLSRLNASFRGQFDRQHLAASQSTEDHANLHLQSILENPLFNAKPRTRETSTGKTQSIGQSRGQLQNHTSQALNAFRERVSHGIADFQMAKRCLIIQHDACLASGAATKRQAMQSCGAGSTILQWLWSSGMEDTGIFLHDRQFVHLLIAFLVAEGQQSRISHWLQRCHYSEERLFLSISVSDASRLAGMVFLKLIQHEIRIGGGVEPAFDLFLRTVTDLRRVGFDGLPLHAITKAAAWELVRIIMHHPSSSQPQPPIFHTFSKTVRSISSSTYLDACLSVYSQKDPDPSPALTWFQSPKESPHRSKYRHHRPEKVLLGLRAAELFLKDGRQKEAHWIMEFLQACYKPELGLSESPERQAMVRRRVSRYSLEPNDSPNIEERNLQLLDTLTAP